MPKQFIAIIGGIEPDPVHSMDPSLLNHELAVSAAEDIGTELAEAGFGIVVYSSDPKFIEPHVVKGYLKVRHLESDSIQVRHPAKFPNKYPDIKAFDFQPDPSEEWEVSFYQSIRKTEGMLLLGGGHSTLIAGISAIPDRKPLISVASFGSAAYKVWMLLSKDNHLMTDAQHTLMARTWPTTRKKSRARAAELVAGLKNQIKRKQREGRAKNDLPVVLENGLRIAWLSDLHLSEIDEEKKDWLNIIRDFPREFLEKTFFQFKGSKITQHFPKENLTAVLKRIEQLKPDHILVTGDCTNFARENQFDILLEMLKNTQTTLNPEFAQKGLDPRLWTILPGNHDITHDKCAAGSIRHNLGMFFTFFKSLYSLKGPDYDNAFPFYKQLPLKSNNGLRLFLIGLDSNESNPVSEMGFNAQGRIDDQQLKRLNDLLADADDSDITVVALHHYPVIMPFISSNIHNYFMSLDTQDADILIKMCANSGVSAILHGHFHDYSFWSMLVPQGTHKMAVLGSPAGTRDLPGNIEFLELREAYRDSISGKHIGLALFRHAFSQNKWGDEYITFIESKQIIDD